MEKYCENCKEKISDESAKFCPDCGNPLIDKEIEENKADNNPNSEENINYGKGLVGLIVSGILLLVAAAISCIYFAPYIEYLAVFGLFDTLTTLGFWISGGATLLAIYLSYVIGGKTRAAIVCEDLMKSELNHNTRLKIANVLRVISKIITIYAKITGVLFILWNIKDYGIGWAVFYRTSFIFQCFIVADVLNKMVECFTPRLSAFTEDDKLDYRKLYRYTKEHESEYEKNFTDEQFKEVDDIDIAASIINVASKFTTKSPTNSEKNANDESEDKVEVEQSESDNISKEKSGDTIEEEKEV